MLPLLLLPASGSHSREGWFGACALLNRSQKIRRGAGGRRGEKTRQEDRFRSMRLRYRNTIERRGSSFLCFSHCLITRTDPPALRTKKMPKSPPCVFQWSSLWLASLATLVVQSVLSSSYSSSSSSTYQRPATGGKRPGFMERTLILLDVNTRSPIRVLNDNFLSLQLDPSVIKDGWLDFLRYWRAFQQYRSVSVSTSKMFWGSLIH